MILSFSSYCASMARRTRRSSSSAAVIAAASSLAAIASRVASSTWSIQGGSQRAVGVAGGGDVGGGKGEGGADKGQKMVISGITREWGWREDSASGWRGCLRRG